jgi:hypothetical protein
MWQSGCGHIPLLLLGGVWKTYRENGNALSFPCFARKKSGVSFHGRLVYTSFSHGIAQEFLRKKAEPIKNGVGDTDRFIAASAHATRVLFRAIPFRYVHLVAQPVCAVSRLIVWYCQLGNVAEHCVKIAS